MATYTPIFGLIKPDEDDFYDIQVFNSNAEKIDAALATIDCGNWDESDIDSALADHNINPLAHAALVIDGGIMEEIEVHDSDEEAHHNLEIDGGTV